MVVASPRPAPPPPPRSVGRRLAGPLLLLAASLLLSLGVAEIAVRLSGVLGRLESSSIAFWPWVIYDPIAGRTNRAGFEDPALGVRINALGFKGDEVVVPKPAGTFRIVCLGDSTTFGIYMERPSQVRAHASYPAALQELLRSEGWDDVEVVNAGVLGQTSAHGLAQLLTKVLRLEPDVVTIRFGNNDHGRRLGTDRLPASGRIERWLMRKAPAWVFDLHLVGLAFHVYRTGGNAGPAIQARLITPPEFHDNLVWMIDAARAAGAHVLLLDFPYRPLERGVGTGEAFPNALQAARTLDELHAIHDEYQAVVRGVAEETDTPLLVSKPALQAAHQEVFTDADMSHPTAAGSALLARLLRDELLELGWLPPRRAPRP